jgi:hypothetical protein
MWAASFPLETLLIGQVVHQVTITTAVLTFEGSSGEGDALVPSVQGLPIIATLAIILRVIRTFINGVHEGV